MSTSLVSLDQAKVPAHVAARIGKDSKLSLSLAGGIGSGAVPRISIKGSRFRIVEEGNESVLPEVELNVVIVGANPRLSKVFYLKQWTPEQEPSNPDCFSLDGIAPDLASPAPQNGRCADCPQNAWGSRTTAQGGQVKACADQKRLAVVSASDVGGPVYLMQVPPASLRGLNGYHKELSRRGIPPEIVSTIISFDTDASHPKLAFRFGGFLSEVDQGVVDELFTAETVLEITGEKVTTSIIDVLPKVAQPAAPVAPAPKPANKVEAPAPKPIVAPIPAAKPMEPVLTTSVPPPAKRGFGAPKVVPPATVTQAATASAVNPLSDLESEVARLISGESDDAK